MSTAEVPVDVDVLREAIRETYPDGWESPRPYIRIVPQPDRAPLVSPH